mmetsp:Transcript_54452/g.130064  ORF Transcript_54452/g.130064 Transcript_54452/m.130064 type:complete len:205 (-) Transcript_54452:314-928(-)
MRPISARNGGEAVGLPFWTRKRLSSRPLMLPSTARSSWRSRSARCSTASCFAPARGWHSSSRATRTWELTKSFACARTPFFSQNSALRLACRKADVSRAFDGGAAPGTFCSWSTKSAMWKWQTATSRSSLISSKRRSALPKCRSANSTIVSRLLPPREPWVGTRRERWTASRRCANAPSRLPSVPSLRRTASSHVSAQRRKREY